MKSWFAAAAGYLAVAAALAAYWLLALVVVPGIPRLPAMWLPAAQLASLLLVAGLGAWLGWSMLGEMRRLRQTSHEVTRFTEAVNRTGNAVFLTQPDGVVEWFNQGFTQLTGFSADEMLGKPLSALAHGQFQGDAPAQKWRERFATQRPFSLELPCTHKRGHRLWLQLDFTPCRDEQGRLANYVGVGADTTSRRKAEEELTRLNHRTAMLLDAVGEGVCAVDLQGNITFCNPAATRLLGWTPVELVGRPVSTILHQLRVDRLSGGADDLFSAAAFLDGSVLIGDGDSFRRKDGTHFAVEYTSTPVKEGHDLVGTVVVFRDATERRQTELVRTRQTRQFAFRAEVAFALSAGSTLHSFLDRTAQVVLKTLDGAFARVWTLNEQEAMLELQASAGIYTHIDGHHSRIPVGTLKVGMLAKHRLPEVNNDLVNDPNIGDRPWLLRERIIGFAGYPLILENKLVGVIGVFTRNRLPDDTIELLGSVADTVALGIIRKRAEEKIVEQAALLDKSQDAIAVIDLDGRCTFWNRCAERLYGRTAQEVYGYPVDSLICPDRAYFERARSEVMTRGEWRDENCQVKGEPTPLVVESQWTLVTGDNRGPKSILIVNTDVSERKKIESQFLRTQRIESIGTLAGGIAHDLNNVLSPILMSVEILRKKLTDEQSQRMLTMLEATAKRGAGMVKQLLTFGRGLDGERIVLQPRHLIKEINKIITETFPKTIKFKSKIGDGLWTIKGDATQLHQVLVNLAVNARDAMPEGGQIALTAENAQIDPLHPAAHDGIKPGDYILIKVSDTGTGIPAEIFDKIFEPFFTTKPVGKGTGLGLSTVLGIVKSHGGFLQVQTEANRGTTFLIYLPAMEAGTTAGDEEKSSNLPTGHGELLLVVDDEPAVLSMLRETLEAFGYRVLTATDGTEAVPLYTAQRHEIKLVLTDMFMPRMDGPATIRVLRGIDPAVKIIAASGLMDSDRVHETTGVEGIPLLMKPYTAETLLSTVSHALQPPAPGAKQIAA